MISNDMREYEYYFYEQEDEYGQLTLTDYAIGSVKMAIYPTSQSIQDNINYTGANYIGLTYDTLCDTEVVEYEGEKLKVLYVNKLGRLNQVFMAKL